MAQSRASSTSEIANRGDEIALSASSDSDSSDSSVQRVHQQQLVGVRKWFDELTQCVAEKQLHASNARVSVSTESTVVSLSTPKAPRRALMFHPSLPEVDAVFDASFFQEDRQSVVSSDTEVQQGVGFVRAGCFFGNVIHRSKSDSDLYFNEDGSPRHDVKGI